MPFLPLLKPSVSQKEIEAVTKVLKSGWWGMGPVTEKLEEEFAQLTDSKHAIALNSATSGLHLAIKVLKANQNKANIITTPLTFVSTAAVSLYEDIEVRFADIDPDTLCLDHQKALQLVDKNTIAIIPVHYAGTPAHTSNYQTPVIEDCAHAAGSPTAGRTGIMSVWSFHPVKNIATGDGGMITTNDDQLAHQLKSLRWMGIDKDTWTRETGGYNWEYNIKDVGYKYHANDILSAIALTQLRRLKTLNTKRLHIAKRYTKALRNLPITLPPDSDTWHLYVIRVPKKLRNPFIDYMRTHHISAGVHYKPLHHYPIFQWKKPLPVTDKVFPTIVDLPIYPDLKKTDQEKIIQHIKKFFTKNKLG